MQRKRPVATLCGWTPRCQCRLRGPQKPIGEPLRLRLQPALFVLFTMLLYAAVQLHFDRAGMYQISGDEPHYLVNGLSIAQDGDLKLDNNYAALNNPGIGPLFPHAYETANGWYPFRGIGVPLLVAWPGTYFGAVGARVALALLVGLLTLPVYYVARRVLHDSTLSIAVSAAFLWALPFVVCAGLLFPDVLTGALSFAATALLFARTDAVWRLRDRVLFACAVSAICVVYWRHLPVLGVFALAFIAQSLWLHGVRSVAQFKLRALFSRPSFRQDLGVLVALALCVAFTAAYILWYQLTSRGDGFIYITAPWRWIEPFVGHHLDQNHGILWRNPLLWLALPGWYLLWRQQRALFVLIAALYVVLLLPQCMTDMQYGAHGIGGRYTWNFIWLWFFPLCAMIAWMRDIRHAGRCLGALIGASFFWQLTMAPQWFTGAQGNRLLMFQSVKTPFTGSILGEARWILPAFNFDGSAFSSLLNLWWLALVLLALAFVPLMRLIRIPRQRLIAALAVSVATLGVSLLGLARSSQPSTLAIEADYIASDEPLLNEARTRAPGQGGFVGYYARFKLAPGHYRCEFDYTAPLGGVGWELRRAAQMGNSARIDIGVLPPVSESHPRGRPLSDASFNFNVGIDDEWPIAGVSLWTDGTGPVSLRSINLTRLGPPTGPSGQPQD